MMSAAFHKYVLGYASDSLGGITISNNTNAAFTAGSIYYQPVWGSQSEATPKAESPLAWLDRRIAEMRVPLAKIGAA